MYIARTCLSVFVICSSSVKAILFSFIRVIIISYCFLTHRMSENLHEVSDEASVRG